MPKSIKRDVILIAALIVPGLLLALWLLLSTQRGGTVLVRVDGEITASYPLSQNVTVELQTADGGTNLLVIENGTARIDEANCPDGVCVRTGKISRSGQSIICLPHKLSVEISAEDEPQVDFVSGIGG